jgi:hypothetical protein
LADEPAVPYFGNAGVNAGDGASARPFEGQLAFLRVENGLDPLADSAKFPEARFFIFPIWSGRVGSDRVESDLVESDQFGFEFSGDEVLEVSPGEAGVAVQ